MPPPHPPIRGPLTNCVCRLMCCKLFARGLDYEVRSQVTWLYFTTRRRL
jgi:hypothetical protein